MTTTMEITSKEMLHKAKVARAKRKAYGNFLTFFKADPPAENYKYGWHTIDIANQLDGVVKDVENGISRYLLIEVPFRHGKSDLASRRFPAWTLIRNPKWEVILASYGYALAEELSGDARRCYRAMCSVYGGGISAERDQMKVWKTLEGGGLFATGLGGVITGRGGNIIIIDDYLKNREDAESITIREKIGHCFKSDLMTRRAPVSGVVVIANRWHVDDLAGRIRAYNDLENESYDPEFPKFETITYPAQDERGRWLFSERFGDDWYREMKAIMGRYAWGAQAQQNPQPRTGNMLRADKVIVEDSFPVDLLYRRGWDVASSKKERAKDDPDWTVGTKVAFVNGHLWIADVARFRLAAVQRDQTITRIAKQDGRGVRVRVEVVGAYKDAADYLRRTLGGFAIVEEVHVSTDKVARAACIEAIFDAGKVHILRGHWNQNWLAEIASFPSGRHDDQVDSLIVGCREEVMRGKSSPITDWGGKEECDIGHENEIDSAGGVEDMKDFDSEIDNFEEV